jgi:hypothetical protein
MPLLNCTKGLIVCAVGNRSAQRLYFFSSVARGIKPFMFAKVLLPLPLKENPFQNVFKDRKLRCGS